MCTAQKILAALFIFFSQNCFAEVAIIPTAQGFVNDLAFVLDTKTSGQITNVLTQFKKETGNEVAVLTLKSLEGGSIEDFTVRQYKEWGIGEKGKDNGALVLVVTNDREMRIEVGYGLEPYINDALAGRIIRETMIPHFREGNFSLGILNGVVELVSIIANKTGVEFDAQAAGSISAEELYHVRRIGMPDSPIIKIIKILALIFIILLFIKNPWAALFILSNMAGGRGGSFRGGFGGGFGGFGGGLSGGGGASGRW